MQLACGSTVVGAPKRRGHYLGVDMYTFQGHGLKSKQNNSYSKITRRGFRINPNLARHLNSASGWCGCRRFRNVVNDLGQPFSFSRLSGNWFQAKLVYKAGLLTPIQSLSLSGRPARTGTVDLA